MKRVTCKECDNLPTVKPNDDLRVIRYKANRWIDHFSEHPDLSALASCRTLRDFTGMSK